MGVFLPIGMFRQCSTSIPLAGSAEAIERLLEETKRFKYVVQQESASVYVCKQSSGLGRFLSSPS